MPDVSAPLPLVREWSLEDRIPRIKRTSVQALVTQISPHHTFNAQFRLAYLFVNASPHGVGSFKMSIDDLPELDKLIDELPEELLFRAQKILESMIPKTR